MLGELLERDLAPWSQLLGGLARGKRASDPLQDRVQHDQRDKGDGIGNGHLDSRLYAVILRVCGIVPSIEERIEIRGGAADVEDVGREQEAAKPHEQGSGVGQDARPGKRRIARAALRVGASAVVFLASGLAVGETALRRLGLGLRRLRGFARLLIGRATLGWCGLFHIKFL